MTIQALYEIEQILTKYLKDFDPEGFGCACTPTSKCGPCTEAKRQEPLKKALEAAQRGLTHGATSDWKEAVINELVVCHILTEEHERNPRKAIKDAISWNCEVALDPQVSSDAQALVDRGYDKAIALVTDLVTSLKTPEKIDFSETVPGLPDSLTHY